jgi:phage FluMu protein Com
MKKLIVAIRCEACDEYGTVAGRDSEHREMCPICRGFKWERPPVDHDTDARKHVEGKTDE